MNQQDSSRGEEQQHRTGGILMCLPEEARENVSHIVRVVHTQHPDDLPHNGRDNFLTEQEHEIFAILS